MNDNYKKFLELTKKYPSKPFEPNQVAPTKVPTEPTTPVTPTSPGNVKLNKKTSPLIKFGIILMGAALVIFALRKYDQFKERQRDKHNK